MADQSLQVILELNDKASKKVLSIIKSMEGANVRLERSQKRAAASTKGLSDSFKVLRNVFLTLGIAKVIGDTARAAIDFEEAFAGVRKTVDATEKEFQQLSNQLIQLSREIPVSAKELARIEELAGQLGVRGVKNLTEFTKTIAKISVTTNLTQERAATDFARIANIMQTPISEVDRMASAVVDLGNNFATTESEIVDFANRIAGAGKVVGLTEADIFAFGTAFSSVGVQAERGGTAVNKALIQIADAVQNGGEKLSQFAQIAGLTSEQFVEAFQKDAGKAFAVFIEGLGKSGLEGARILKELELGDQRLVQSFLSVGGASGILTRAIDDSNKAFRENNALNVEAEKRFATTASSILLIKNNITSLQIEIGNKLLPVFEKLLKVTKQYVDFVTGADLQRTEIELLTDAYNNQKRELEELVRIRDRAFGRRLFDPEFLVDDIELANRKLAVLAGKINEINNSNSITSSQPTDTIQNADSALSSEEETNRVKQQMLELSIIKQDFSNKQLELDKSVAREQTAVLNEYKANFDAAHASMATLSIRLSQTIREGFGSALASIATGAQNANDAFRDLGKTMIAVIVDFIAQKVIASLLEKTLLKQTVTSAAIAGAATAAAWAPAALFANVASFGGAGAAAAASFGIAAAAQIGAGAATKLAAGSQEIQSFHDGGIIRGRTDDIPIIAQRGEGVLSRRGLDNLGGEENLNRLNNGEGLNSGGDINITINFPKMSREDEVSTLADQLGSEIQRQLRYARA